jgi:hypothetical protein
MPARLIGAVAALVLLIPLGALAAPGQGEGRQGGGSSSGGRADLQASGGGQVVMDGAGGAGDTIAFVAQRLEAGAVQEPGDDENPAIRDARGQLQVINRSAGTGRDQTRFHGTVTCFADYREVGEENVARFGGVGRDSTTNAPVRFVVDVTDMGEQGTDMVAFRRLAGDEGNPCADDGDGTELRSSALARGNVKIHRR